MITLPLSIVGPLWRPRKGAKGCIGEIALISPPNMTVWATLRLAPTKKYGISLKTHQAEARSMFMRG
jgi:hypothetical protein